MSGGRREVPECLGQPTEPQAHSLHFLEAEKDEGPLDSPEVMSTGEVASGGPEEKPADSGQNQGSDARLTYASLQFGNSAGRADASEARGTDGNLEQGRVQEGSAGLDFGGEPGLETPAAGDEGGAQSYESDQSFGSLSDISLPDGEQEKDAAARSSTVPRAVYTGEHEKDAAARSGTAPRAVDTGAEEKALPSRPDQADKNANKAPGITTASVDEASSAAKAVDTGDKEKSRQDRAHQVDNNAQKTPGITTASLNKFDSEMAESVQDEETAFALEELLTNQTKEVALAKNGELKEDGKDTRDTNASGNDAVAQPPEVQVSRQSVGLRISVSGFVTLVKTVDADLEVSFSPETVYRSPRYPPDVREEIIK